MAELILTEKEKADASYLDWDDDALGKLTRKLSARMHDKYGRDGQFAAMAAHLLIDLARRVNATTSTINLKGATVAGEAIGDWKITIKRTDV